MSERYNVQASDVLGENYKITSVECSDYNPSIDDDITVTITVTDVYGDAITGETVTVTASEGTFTELNGSTITAAASVTGTTNSSGQFTLTYSCTEWGLITFSANNENIQIKVTGFKQVESHQSGKILVYRDEKTMFVKVAGSFTVSATTQTLATLTLKPIYTQVVSATAGNTNRLSVGSDGKVNLITSATSGTQNSYTSIYLPIAE